MHNTILFAIHTIDPGLVSELQYFQNTDTSVNITWKPPKEPNGNIEAYFVEHGVYQNESTTESVSLSAEDRRLMHIVIQNLSKSLLLHTCGTGCCICFHCSSTGLDIF